LRQLELASPLPDLIISDISMPHMNGFELFETVRSHTEWIDIPFIFLTARSQIEDLRRGYDLGADDYLVKPFDQEHLLLIIRSKLKRREEWLERLRGQQQAITEARQVLATMVAHELRTPLMSISMVSDMLSREFDRMDGDQVRELLEAMQGGSARMNRLVEQMIMYVQLQSGALSDSIRRLSRPSPVHDLLVGALDRAQQFNYRQFPVSVDLEQRTPGLMVKGDLASIRHALAEVVLNAMGFSRSGGVVRVVQWADSDAVCISVIDQGAGISPDEVEHVFEPFYQAGRHRSEQQGIGIGLTLARGIVEMHGGSLVLESHLRIGTQVVMTLPLFHESA
jgi:signal transduction histidine kinase